MQKGEEIVYMDEAMEELLKRVRTCISQLDWLETQGNQMAGAWSKRITDAPDLKTKLTAIGNLRMAVLNAFRTNDLNAQYIAITVFAIVPNNDQRLKDE